LEETKLASKKDQEWRLKEMVKDAGRKTKDVEDDGFFVVGDEDDEDSSDGS
jgi:hypothetical protein